MRRWTSGLAMALCMLATLVASAPARAFEWWQEGDRIFFQYGFYTWHFNENPEHVNQNHLLNLEYQRKGTPWLGDTGQHLIGYAWFYNSFGQPSWYVYYGRQWDLAKWIPYSYVKLSGGIVHGYDDQYQDKIPFNNYGYAPVIIPSFGVRYREFSLEAILLGNSAMMFGVGYRF
jgi:hypothetical protein